MFRIKICGITNVEDARGAVDAGADAIGLNFYEKSPRCVTVEQAREICETVEHRALCVGVFVNASMEVLLGTLTNAGIDGIQLHGDEPPEFIAELAKALPPQLPPYAENLFERLDEQMVKMGSAIRKSTMEVFRPFVIRARRMTEEGAAAIAADVEACRGAGGAPGAVLADAFTPGQYGGTGETVSWAELSDHRTWLRDVPLILAGGLTPENVAEAIRVVRPHAVDVASGVESSPGVKDHGKVRAFVEAARLAY